MDKLCWCDYVYCQVAVVAASLARFEVVDVLDIAHGCDSPYVNASQGCADPGRHSVADTRSYCYLFMISVQGFEPPRPPI